MKLIDVTFRDPVNIPGNATSRHVKATQLDALFVEGPMVVLEKGAVAKGIPLSNVVESTFAPKAKK